MQEKPRVHPVKTELFKMNLKSAMAFSGIVMGDALHINHIPGITAPNMIYYFAGGDVDAIIQERDDTHASLLEEPVLKSRAATTLRRLMLAGELTKEHGSYHYAEAGKAHKLPKWLTANAKNSVVSYAIGTFGSAKRGHGEVRELYRHEFNDYMWSIIKLLEPNKEKLLKKGLLNEDGEMGRNALYDVFLSQPEIYIAPFGAVGGLEK